MANDWEELAVEDVAEAIADAIDEVILQSAGLEVESVVGDHLLLKEIATGPDSTAVAHYQVTVTRVYQS